jgi:RHS repeat-associated protein
VPHILDFDVYLFELWVFDLNSYALLNRVYFGASAGQPLADHFGTARVVTNASGTVQDDSDFYPYAGERVVSSSSGNHYKFTGKERDSESGLDDFGARYYSSQYGRFMIPDWAAKATSVPYADFGNPQTLNLYAIVHNNPESLADLDGHQCTGFDPGCVAPPQARIECGCGAKADDIH